MDQGQNEEWIAEQCYRQKLDLPEKILNAPELRLGLEMYWDAYGDLSSDRPASFGGVLPIPYMRIVEYARMQEFSTDQTEDILYLVRKMDDAFRKWHEKKHGNK